ncbi:hypothetical protein SLS62_004910 [Diatrype stigma]|uniref:Uncharacterized protein n=1 Tax=Diatrype stigma TaxID=117547 RepID=A0AAN9UTY7_9PEZI
MAIILYSVAEAARLVVLQDGISGLFGRGLKTRILANGLQGLLFSILWKLFLDLYVNPRCSLPMMTWANRERWQLGQEDWFLTHRILLEV